MWKLDIYVGFYAYSLLCVHGMCPCILYMLHTKILILLAKLGQLNFKGLFEG